MSDRAEDLDRIRQALGSAVADETRNSLVCNGDSLELLAAMPAASASLILTDPPYHSTNKAISTATEPQTSSSSHKITVEILRR